MEEGRNFFPLKGSKFEKLSVAVSEEHSLVHVSLFIRTRDEVIIERIAVQ